MELFQKLLRVQSELKAPKGQYNKFGKYYYRSCEDITEAVKPLLAEEGIVMTISDELIMVGDRYYIKATVTVTDGENSNKVTGYAREAENKKGMDCSQITGAASSYARKYALNGMFAIDDTKDADATNQHGEQKPKATEKQYQLIENIVEQLGADMAATKRRIRERFGFGYDNMSKEQANEVISVLEEKLSEKRQKEAQDAEPDIEDVEVDEEEVEQLAESM